MADYTQDTRLVALDTPLGDDKLLVRSITGTEGLSQLFRFSLDLLSTDPNLNFDDIVGKNVTARVSQGDDAEPRYFNGFISSFAQMYDKEYLNHYEAEMVPWLWFLTRTAACRIFQGKSVPEIIEQVFKDHGFSDYKLRLQGSYPQLDYCVQYRETACDFVMRLMEREGIFFFFEHENGKHTMVMGDSSSAHQDIPNSSMRFDLSSSGQVGVEELVTSWRNEQEIRTGKYTLSDYNPLTPDLDLKVTVDTIISSNANYEVFDFPGEYDSKGDGDRYVRLRMEEEETAQRTITGGGDCPRFSAGFRFTLTGHERQDQNGKYTLTSVAHRARQGGFHTGDTNDVVYANTFTCIPAATPYRPPRTTPRPVVRGTQTATVVGPEGEEIYSDKYGRVKVRFYWDYGGDRKDYNSCWIRVSQPWAGAGWGAIALPRIGQEVIVDFLEGDPDRPIIVGRVYNGHQMPPYPLPDSQTKTAIKSYSTKGGGGFNEFRFEDKKGEEQVFVHAEKNYDLRVKKDVYETIEEQRHLIVKKDNFEQVEHDSHFAAKNDLVEKVGRDHHLAVTGKEAVSVGQSLSLKVTGDVIEAFQMNHSENVGLQYYLKSNQVIIEATMGMTLKCGGNSVVIDMTGVTITAPMITIDGSMVRIASGPGSPAMSGNAGSPVSPLSPKDPFEADKADPGEMAQIKAQQLQTKSGKYGAVRVNPFKPGSDSDKSRDKKKTWIEIVLKDEDGNPVPGEPYRITLPDGSVSEGTLDQNGFARVDGIDPGTCEVTFPNLDKDTWDKA